MHFLSPLTGRLTIIQQKNVLVTAAAAPWGWTQPGVSFCRAAAGMCDAALWHCDIFRSVCDLIFSAAAVVPVVFLTLVMSKLCCTFHAEFKGLVLADIDSGSFVRSWKKVLACFLCAFKFSVISASKHAAWWWIVHIRFSFKYGSAIWRLSRSETLVLATLYSFYCTAIICCY